MPGADLFQRQGLSKKIVTKGAFSWMATSRALTRPAAVGLFVLVEALAAPAQAFVAGVVGAVAVFDIVARLAGLVTCARQTGLKGLPMRTNRSVRPSAFPDHCTAGAWAPASIPLNTIRFIDFRDQRK